MHLLTFNYSSTLISHNFKTTCLILWVYLVPPIQLCPVEAWTPQDLWSCPVVSMWHQDPSRRSLKSCCELGPPWIWLVLPAHPQMLDGTETWVIEPLPNNVCSVAGRIILLPGLQQCLVRVKVTSTGMPGPKVSQQKTLPRASHTASTGLLSSHSASWCHLLPR